MALKDFSIVFFLENPPNNKKWHPKKFDRSPENIKERYRGKEKRITEPAKIHSEKKPDSARKRNGGHRQNNPGGGLRE